MTKPRFSVIMPSHNAASTIRDAALSVLAQTESDFQLIIVDDGSRDESWEIIQDLARQDGRIMALRQANAGPAAARNYGILLSNGAIIAFLDADDRWDPSALARHRAHFDTNRGCCVSFARVRFYDETLRHAGAVSAYVPALTLAHILGENPLCTTSNIVVRRDVFAAAGLFDEALTHGEDQEFTARIVARAPWMVCGLPDILVHYRMSPAGLSADLDRTEAGWRAMLERVRSYAPEAVQAAEADASALFHRYLARRALRTRQGDRALAPMLNAIRTSPGALLRHQPRRTALTIAGALAARLPGNPAGALLTR